jgi:hypothetical protein
MNEIVKLEDGKYGLAQDAIDTIITIEKEFDKIKSMQEKYRERLLSLMEEYDVKEIDIPELKITRKFATTREKLNSKKLRKEHPDIYDDCIEITDVKGSISVKVK